MISKASTELIAYFVRAHRGRTAAMVLLLVFSGLAEGLGFLSLFPALEFVAGVDGAEASPVTEGFATMLSRLGIALTLGTMLFLVAMSIALKSTFLWLAMRQVGYTVSHVAMQLRLQLIRALMHASWGHFTSQPTGFYAFSISEEAHRASWAYRAACEAAGGVIRIAAYLMVAFTFSRSVALSALIVSALVLFLFKSFVSMGREAGYQQVAVMRSLTKRITEALPGIKSVKAMGRERFLLPMLEGDAQALNRAQRMEVLASESLKSVREPVIVAAICAGLYAVVPITSEPFAGVMVLVLLFYRIVGTVNVLQLNAQAVAIGEEAFRSIRDHIELAERNRETTAGTRAPPALDESVTFDNVKVCYTEASVLDSVTFRLPARSLTVLVGPSGSGKTTILDLIARLREPSGGKILVDGIPLDELDVAEGRRHIGYVPQDVSLFYGSILDNVTLGDDSLTRAAVERALRDAGAWEFVAASREGMNRIVGEGGSMVSGGQRQRILMARALVGSPKLLLLDEATTALDPKTEAQLCVNLRALSKKVMVVAVSHQAALRDVAEQVFDVANGSVAPHGSGPSHTVV